MTPEKDVDSTRNTDANDAADSDASAQDVLAQSDVQVADGAVNSAGAGEAEGSADDAGQGNSPVADEESVDALKARLAIAEDQAAANWDRLLRLQADVENQRKRAQRELANARKFALEGIANDLLPIKDSLELGIAAAQGEGGSVEKLLEGSELTLKMLSQCFEKNGVVEINPVDEKFNPEFHEAMSMQAVEGKASNTVTAVLRKGYTLNERLIRPAQVLVAR